MKELESYWDEMQSAYLYEVLARYEKGHPREKLFRCLGDESRKQAEIWKRKIPAELIHPYAPTLRVRMVAFLIEKLGPRAILPILASMKIRGLSIYQHQHHSTKEEGARHRAIQKGGSLRAAVFGMNDGLVSNLGLILGVAGATNSQSAIVTSGFAGLIAGAFSMAAGEYISVRTQRELYENQMALERAELEAFPEEEAEELALIYQAKGAEESEAKRMADAIIANPEKALDTLAREELGLNPHDLGNPLGAAISSFVAFAVGALIPLSPFFFAQASMAVCLGLSAFSLFAIGMAITLFTGKRALWGGVRMLFIGILAGGITYGIGTLLGVSV